MVRLVRDRRYIKNAQPTGDYRHFGITRIFTEIAASACALPALAANVFYSSQGNVGLSQPSHEPKEFVPVYFTFRFSALAEL
jgi:hypothetical protein